MSHLYNSNKISARSCKEQPAFIDFLLCKWRCDKQYKFCLCEFDVNIRAFKQQINRLFKQDSCVYFVDS